MKLADVIVGVAHKRLTLVDISGQRGPGRGSNQHELNTGRAMRELLDRFVSGSSSTLIPIRWLSLVDDEDPRAEDGTVRLYDTRANKPHRSAEWRLYYDGDPLDGCRPGDYAIFVLTRDFALHGLLVENGSEWHDELERLFGIDFERGELPAEARPRAGIVPSVALDAATAGPRQILLFDQLGIDVDDAPAAPSDVDIVVSHFGTGRQWPSTSAMIELAHELVPTIDDPDEQLVAWIAREHELFRALERVRASDRIRRGFITDSGDVNVDEFIQFSLSMNNRRKSRMGHSLEGHLAALFRRAGIAFDQQQYTEGRRRPDFLFPGHAAYVERDAGDPSLAMLAAKSTCKDRWRQILNEAAKIPTKHLCTLQPSLSVHQLNEMDEERVVLVVPARDHAAYPIERRRRIWSIDDFIVEQSVNS